MKTRTKYNSKKVEYEGIMFDSKDECDFYKFLLENKEHMETASIILQPKFELIPNYEYFFKKRRGVSYTADFMVKNHDGKIVVFDVKGFPTQQGELRRKMFEYKYPELRLIWMAKSMKYGKNGWIDTDELKKIRAKNKKTNA